MCDYEKLHLSAAHLIGPTSGSARHRITCKPMTLDTPLGSLLNRVVPDMMAIQHRPVLGLAAK